MPNQQPRSPLTPALSLWKLTDKVDTVLGPPQLLDQVLHILLQQAHKHTVADGVTSHTDTHNVTQRVVCTLVGRKKQIALRCFMLSLF